MRLAVLAILVLAVSACTPAAREEAQCRARGGEMQAIGIDANRYCVVPYGDGGRPCTDGEQCRGDCMADQVTPTGTTGVQGYCAWNGFMAGCLRYLEDGVIVQGPCLD